jgi:putative ABC transport system permease protein
VSWDRDLDEEIRFHLDMEAEKNRRNGMSDAEARRAAARAFGGIRRVHEQVRDLRRTRWIEDLLRDISYGWRTLRQTPAYALTTILTMALAVGVSSAILTFVEGTLLRPLPYAPMDRIVTLWETNLASGENHLEVSPANYLDWKKSVTAFASMGLLSPHGFDLRRGDRTFSINSARISVEYLPALGVKPLLGRLFEASDYDPGAEPRVLLSHRIWRDVFDARRTLVNETIELDGKPALVLGILPPGIEYPAKFDIWAPLRLYPGEASDRSGNWMTAVARLRDGVTLEQAAADLDRAAQTLAREYPATNEKLRTRIVPLRETILGNARRLLTALGAASACLLLLACANIGALTLARGMARRRELAIRAAVGAGTARLVRQLVTEAAMLNAIAAALAFAIAFAVVRWMSANTPAALERMNEVHTGPITVALLLLLTVIATALSGVLPALRLAGKGLARSLDASRRDSGVNRSEMRLQAALVTTQLALALLLLTGASLLLRSLQKLTANDLGFDPGNLATIQMYLYDVHPDLDERAQFVRTSLEAMRHLPGAVDAAATSAIPFDPAMNSRDNFEIVGRPRRAGESLMMETAAISPGYFRTMKIPLRAGRDFTDADGRRTQRVAIINDAAARRFWHGQSPVGSRIRIGIMGRPYEWMIVGVVRTVRDEDYAALSGPQVYVPLSQSGVGGVDFVVRTRTAPATLLPAMQDVIWSATPSQSIVAARVVTDIIARTVQTRRFAVMLMTGFGVAALLVASIGLFGLLTYIGTRRRAEVGIRLALGATPLSIEALFVRRGLALTAMGILAGLLVSLAFTRVLDSFLYQTSSWDPPAIAAVVAATGFVALLASWIPARRIAALEPSVVLRLE